MSRKGPPLAIVRPRLPDPVSILSFLFRGLAEPVLGTECVWIAGCPDVCR